MTTRIKWQELNTEILAVLSRVIFGFTLLAFFWRSALTKLGEGATGFISPSAGAFAQIFPMKFESVGYDPSAMSFFDSLIVLAGIYAEFLLPLLIVVGFMTRLAALGMIIFIVIMSVVDVTGHGVALGSLLDSNPSSLIPDQRLYWGLPLLVLMLVGAGRISLDALCRRRNQASEASYHGEEN